MFRSRDRVQRSGLEEADDALLFVPRTVPHAFVAGQRYADSSSSHATVRGHRRGDPGGRWLALSVRTPCGLNTRRAAGSTCTECQTLPRCSDNAPAGRPLSDGRDPRDAFTSSPHFTTSTNDVRQAISVRRRQDECYRSAPANWRAERLSGRHSFPLAYEVMDGNT